MFENVNKSSKYNHAFFGKAQTDTELYIWKAFLEMLNLFRTFRTLPIKVVCNNAIHRDFVSLRLYVCCHQAHVPTICVLTNLGHTPLQGLDSTQKVIRVALIFQQVAFTVFLACFIKRSHSRSQITLRLCSVYILWLPAHYHTSEWLVCNSTGSL